jgi:IS5 family transposase
VVRKITADRGYGEASVDAELEAVGEKTVVIPRKGKPSAARREMEHTRGFRNLVKWRTGSEGRISTLKHGYDWDRTLFDGIGGARTWCGLGILAHNAVRIAPLMEAKAATSPALRTSSPAHAPTATGPPPDPPDLANAC